MAVAGVGKCSASEEQLHHLALAFGHRVVQRRPPQRVHGPHVCIPNQQQVSDRDGTPGCARKERRRRSQWRGLHGRQVQRGPAVVVGQVRVRAAIQQQARHIHVSLSGSAMQGRFAIRAPLRGACAVQEQLRHRHVPGERRHVKRAALGVAGNVSVRAALEQAAHDLLLAVLDGHGEGVERCAMAGAERRVHTGAVIQQQL
mmetsp:Transcript_40719/g.127386  ORF Transcript_40719/g.127386 Transcript_40719/m.127386 type:complete len:201 (-) Transcript_40719:581-1183(-)